MSEQPEVSIQHTFRRAEPTQDDRGGVSTVNGLQIKWRQSDVAFGDAPGTVSPLEVLQAVAARLSSLQRTAQKADINARTLWHVTNAIDQLAGTVPAEDVSKFLRELPE